MTRETDRLTRLGLTPLSHFTAMRALAERQGRFVVYARHYERAARLYHAGLVRIDRLGRAQSMLHAVVRHD